MGREVAAFASGVNSGPVVVGSIGDNLRMDFTAVGDTTNLARLQQEAAPDTILASEAVVRPLRDYLRVLELGPLPIKGRAEPRRPSSARPRGAELALEGGGLAAPRRAGGPAEHELAALRRALAQLDAVAPPATPSASSGIPAWKSSCRAFSSAASWRPARSRVAQGHRAHAGVPYLPWIDVVRGRFGIAEGDAPEAVAEKTGRALAALDLTARETLGHVLRLLGVEDETAARLSPEAIGSGTVEALRQIVLRTSEREPTVLAIENLHWMDRASEECLDAIVELGVAGAHPPRRHLPPALPSTLDGAAHVNQIALASLGPEDSLAIVAVDPEAGALPEPPCARFSARPRATRSSSRSSRGMWWSIARAAATTSCPARSRKC